MYWLTKQVVHIWLRLLSYYQFDSVFDIGSGDGEHKRFMECFGKRVFTVDNGANKHADFEGDFMNVTLDRFPEASPNITIRHTSIWMCKFCLYTTLTKWVRQSLFIIRNEGRKVRAP